MPWLSKRGFCEVVTIAVVLESLCGIDEEKTESRAQRWKYMYHLQQTFAIWL